MFHMNVEGYLMSTQGYNQLRVSNWFVIGSPLSFFNSEHFLDSWDIRVVNFLKRPDKGLNTHPGTALSRHCLVQLLG